MYYDGNLILSDNKKGIPLYTTRTAPPDIPEGMYAIWSGRGWNITDIPPPVKKTEEVIMVDSEVIMVDSSQDSDLSLLGDSST